jgi:cytochrome c peroxidase
MFSALILGAALAFLLLTSNKAVTLDATEDDFNLKLLGKYLFFDKISRPERMSCSTCHDPGTGWTHRNPLVNLSIVVAPGAIIHRVGTVKPPMNAYASLMKPFGPCTNGAASLAIVFPEQGPPFSLCGGNFWNGRAEGNASALFPEGATKHIGSEVLTPQTSGYSEYFGPTADQALNPMPNPVEQNISRKAVCQHVQWEKYAPLYKKAWGVNLDCSGDPNNTAKEHPFDISFKRLMLAICAWQQSDEVNSFSSKRDIALHNERDGQFPLVGFTAKENLGHDLFYNRLPNLLAPEGPGNERPFKGLPITNCSVCHSDNPGVFLFGPPPPSFPGPDTGVEPFQLYSDQSYHNIGVPKNPEIPITPGVDSDAGLFAHTNDPGHLGLHKTPSLRNVDKRPFPIFPKAYTHNGWFKSLKSIVHFYNTAAMEEDLPPGVVKLHNVTRCPPGITTVEGALANNCWPAPAHTNSSAIGFLLGNLGMTPEQEDALVAYMKTLTDIRIPNPPAPYK